MSDCKCGREGWAIYETYYGVPWVCEECFEEFLDEDIFPDEKDEKKP